jgi:hypothetical protein
MWHKQILVSLLLAFALPNISLPHCPRKPRQKKAVASHNHRHFACVFAANYAGVNSPLLTKNSSKSFFSRISEKQVLNFNH